ncbi:hypothetical protein [Streptomyces sp. SAI-090]|uniref:hypothetical protein n=1 Tax=Streptomyces sp. SAI-090 TaxID=2940545 RepID=UPI002476B028|nr:hypothetical protein [Streptomyces sp. SAI-090]
MPQIEPRVLDALMEAANDAVSYEAIATVLAAADIDTNTAAAQQRDALLAALRLRLSGTGKAQDFTGLRPADPLKARLASLSGATPDQLEIWSAYADAVSHPFVRGRLHHLLLVADHGRKHHRARGAAAGYLDAAALLLPAPERRGLARASECLRWAGDLARNFNQKDLQKRVTKDMVALVERVLAAPEDEPGIVELLLEGLRAERYDITDFAERAARRYAGDVQARVGFLKLMKVEPGPRRADIDTQIVEAFLDAADADTNAGFRRHLLLTQAATEARDRGLSELRERAEMALQTTDPDSLGWSRFRRELALPRALFNGARAHIDAAADLRDALWRTAADVHPAMREQADDERAQEGLLRIPRTRINTAGPVQVTPPVDADDNHAVELQVLAGPPRAPHRPSTRPHPPAIRTGRGRADHRSGPRHRPARAARPDPCPHLRVLLAGGARCGGMHRPASGRADPPAAPAPPGPDGVRAQGADTRHRRPTGLTHPQHAGRRVPRGLEPSIGAPPHRPRPRHEPA